jgi:MATE family multidrug resistance protein
VPGEGSERSTILRHAMTVLAGQLAVMAFGVTDTIVAGRHSQASLAALSVGSAIFVSVYVSLMGMLQALMPVWAEHRGAHDWPAIGRSLRQSLYLCLLTCLLGVLVLAAPGPVLRWTEIPEALQGEVRRYLGVLALALPPALLFRIYSTLNQSLGRPQFVAWLQVGSLALKVPLSIWFTFGGAGLEGQGAVGCAWATLVVNYALLGLALWLLRTQPLYTPLQIWRRPERPDWAQIGSFARLGVPAGLAILVEVTSFTLMALFIARQGNLSAASHQIASNLTAVLYMVPLSLAIATSARVSYWRGAQREEQARRVVFMGFWLAVLISWSLSAILFIAKEPLARAYTQDPEVITMTLLLLGWVAIYHMADAVQTVCVFVLRCYRITVLPLVAYCALLWGVGLAGGYVLAYRPWGPWAQSTPTPTPVPFWSASALALAVTAALFSVLLLKTVRRFSPPAPQPVH